MRGLLAPWRSSRRRRPAPRPPAPRASLPDIEDEVMCLECRTPLNVSTSDVADQQRAFIPELIAQGKTKAEVKAALVEEYGPRVLGEPEERASASPRGSCRSSPRSPRSPSWCHRAPLAPRAGQPAARGDGGRRPGGRRPRPRRRPAPRRRARRLRPMSGGVDTTVLAAFAVGFVSFISPCVLPLVPGLPLGGLRRERRRAPEGRALARARPAARDRLLPLVHRRLRRPRDDRDRPRLGARRTAAARSTRSRAS